MSKNEGTVSIVNHEMVSIQEFNVKSLEQVARGKSAADNRTKLTFLLKKRSCKKKLFFLFKLIWMMTVLKRLK